MVPYDMGEIVALACYLRLARTGAGLIEFYLIIILWPGAVKNRGTKFSWALGPCVVDCPEKGEEFSPVVAVRFSNYP